MITFLRKIFLVDLLKGLWLTLTYTPEPAFTFQYPRERRPTAPRFRGVLRLQLEPGTGAQVCIVCDQCAKACPDDLISLGGHREPGQKLKALAYFDFNLSRCSFCGLCSEACPTKPIKALIKNTQNDDAGVEPLVKAISWGITHQGITEGFQAGGTIVVKWNLDVGGMAEPGKTTITWRSQYFTAVGG